MISIPRTKTYGEMRYRYEKIDKRELYKLQLSLRFFAVPCSCFEHRPVFGLAVVKHPVPVHGLPDVLQFAAAVQKVFHISRMLGTLLVQVPEFYKCLTMALHIYKGKRLAIQRVQIGCILLVCDVEFRKGLRIRALRQIAHTKVLVAFGLVELNAERAPVIFFCGGIVLDAVIIHAQIIQRVHMERVHVLRAPEEGKRLFVLAKRQIDATQIEYGANPGGIMLDQRFEPVDGFLIIAQAKLAAANVVETFLGFFRAAEFCKLFQRDFVVPFGVTVFRLLKQHAVLHACPQQQYSA